MAMGQMPGIIILNKMDKQNVPQNTITRDVKYLAAPTGNIYETVVILYKRANQIALAEKKELNKKLEDFKNDRDSMDEVFENREQIEISKYYERQPKPVLVAVAEFQNDELTYRMAKHDQEQPAAEEARPGKKPAAE
ncbi:putative uncharacterized protein [Bacteroides sp. CAG:709]|nr:putative uncharacterized protein [Bacteroides sp. CAG:709]